MAADCACHERCIIAGRTALAGLRSEEHTSELQSQSNLVCRLLLEKKKTLPDVHTLLSTTCRAVLRMVCARFHHPFHSPASASWRTPYHLIPAARYYREHPSAPVSA